MKHILLLSAFLFLMAGNKAAAQDVAPFQSDDIAAIPLTPEVMMQLTNKKWYLHTRKFLLKGKVSEMKYYDVPGHYEFVHGGECKQPAFNGTWSINDAENLLIITTDFLEEAKTKGHALIGGYAIYRITDKELILGKVLTSNYDNKIFYCFENQERHQQRSMSAGIQRRDFATRQIPIRDLEGKTQTTFNYDIPENSKMETNSGKALSKEELFMRGLQAEPGYAYFLDEKGKVFKVRAE